MSRSNSNGPYSGAARSARSFFAFQHPGMLLKLPLRPQERFWLKRMKEGALGYILAFYAESLEAYNYRYFSHASFDDYACGLMACSTVPEEIRDDPEMLRRFPPKRLEGLDETTLSWREVSTESAKVARDIGAPSHHQAAHSTAVEI